MFPDLEFIKTCLNGLRSKFDKLAQDANGKLQASTADWNQNDPDALDYVKGRTHYEANGKVVQLPPKFLPPPTSNTAGAIKADTVKTTDIQPVRLGADGKLYSSGVPIFTTSGNGKAYTANVPEITELVNGMLVVMIPHVQSITDSQTLNINGLGAYPIRRFDSATNSSIQKPYYENWLKDNVPVLLIYWSGYWFACSFTKPNAYDLHGITSVVNGGTGRQTLSKGSYIIGNGLSSVQQKTPSEVLTDIGAIPVPTTAEVGQTVVVKAVDENGKPTEWEPVTLPKQVQSDWNQNNSSAVDYVKNRPFYSEPENVTVENATNEILERFPVFTVGDTVTVKVDGVEYSLVAYYDYGSVTVGDTYNDLENGTGQYGWQIYVDREEVWFYSLEAHTVSYLGSYYHKIDEKYLPETLMKSEYAAYVMPCINANLVKDLIYFSDVIADTTYTKDCTASEWELLMSIITQANNSLIVYATNRLVVQVSLINKNNLIIYGSRYIDGVQKINKTNLQFDETSETLTVTQYAKTL